MVEFSKIVEFKNLLAQLDLLRDESKQIGLCHGCFDLVHFGHVLHFQEAKKSCDVLLCSVTCDKHVNKGPNRPFFTLDRRLIVLAEMNSINFVVASEFATAKAVIDLVKPDVYFKGGDYADYNQFPGLLEEKTYVEKNGGRLVITTSDQSSSTYVHEKLREELR